MILPLFCQCILLGVSVIGVILFKRITGFFFRYHCEKNGAGFAVLFSDTDDVSDEDAAWMMPGSCYAVTC